MTSIMNAANAHLERLGAFSRRRLLMTASALLAPRLAWAQDKGLTPYGATPSPRQLAWHQLETYAFVHFSINTFTDREWGFGDESPALFNPTDFNADQIVAAAKLGGLKGIVFTTKHHDGFCLWPSRFTEHSIKNSPYKDGKGDIVGEMAQACARAGLKFGVYLSPWDRHHADYGRPEYVTYYRNQLRELLTQYGPIFEVWLDGANGGDGYYGGARETRKITREYYDWPSIIDMIHTLQPMAVTFDPKGADVRWVGNEEGYAGDPCWATMDEEPFSRTRSLNGVRDGSVWWPAEVDASIRPGWFWHDYDTPEVKPAGTLQKIYFESVGRGTSLILNIPPDRRGRIPDADVAALTTWGKARRQLFSRNLAAEARAHASNARAGHAAANVLDGARDTYWACDDGVATPELILDMPAARTFDVVRLREYLPLGLRVTAFALDIWDGRWRQIAQHQGIGAQRLVRLDAPVTTSKVRLRVLDAPAGPAISEIGLFLHPVLVDPPEIKRDREGKVTIVGGAPGLQLRYTVNGGPLTLNSTPFTEPFSLPDGGIVQALAIEPKSGIGSAPTRKAFDVAPLNWRIAEATAPGAEALFDENRDTLWRAPAASTVTLDLGQVRSLRGFTLLPARKRPSKVGPPGSYRVATSVDGVTWTPGGEGEFSNIVASIAPQRVTFEPRPARFLRLDVTRSADGEPEIAFAQLSVTTR